MRTNLVWAAWILTSIVACSSSDSGGQAQSPPPDPTCVSDVPCATDLQCATLPGHVCNNALPQPRCQRLECGAEGTGCFREMPGQYPLSNQDDSLCAEGYCRHPEAGPWICRAEALTRNECIAVCKRYSTDIHGCAHQGSGCAEICDAGLAACQDRDGLSDLQVSQNCSSATAQCGDNTLAGDFDM